MLHFTRDEFAARRDRLMLEMTERKLDAMLLFAQESMYWLSGYDSFGFVFFQCLVVKADGEMRLLTRSADLRQARQTSIIDTIVLWRDRGAADPAIDLRDMLDDMGLLGARIGVEWATHGLTAAAGKQLEERLGSFATLRDASDLVPKLRVVKSPAEIDYVRQAASLADDAFDAAMPLIKPGADEAAILHALQGSILAAGGDYPANPFIIGSGREALLCRYKSGRRALDETDQLTLEWAGVKAQYHAALMRTVVIGKPLMRQEELYAAAREALDAVEAMMRPEHTFGDVFDAHAAVMEKHDLVRHRLSACGYSLGATYAPSWMDRPMFMSGNAEPILPNMTLFAHMIIMDSDTDTAMTLGRTYLTTDGDPEPLSRLPLDLPVVA
ncbi:M24 family metallopeptidase [Mangrovibrevibacter kandeliae]|uniref:M24 family metallopeptidase n=1 Tax=Mangrovibrevibacter kandeliae TaxID=2968473 RepID=UPI0021181C71|nr:MULTISPECIES: Xaa-Pro peptidase family protein [unclassified Aurantimonas]MCQ8781025.1 Xaa-Pro peptidase family protein [Aurantimonas sp. CSK15Z-1]MCW4113807.1 Xaa-Pro peptidase family protein [Aurantimonas sp. MSK8Z-1]